MRHDSCFMSKKLLPSFYIDINHKMIKIINLNDGMHFYNVLKKLIGKHVGNENM